MDHAKKKWCLVLLTFYIQLNVSYIDFYDHPESWNLLWLVGVSQSLNELKREVAVIPGHLNNGQEVGSSRLALTWFISWAQEEEVRACYSFEPESSNSLCWSWRFNGKVREPLGGGAYRRTLGHWGCALEEYIELSASPFLLFSAP